ncbi:tripartite tricarboxylate transporter TctB family protein [Paracoccus onubensis]|uniref:tripartite tricarboxylate transporter TctB family protein n=1 Tax=Paracoccus onubensis TaxID=1675788 RepID=UPI00272EFE16|nr:tripartite tricarboxylate transporter TctB family protein [Paracoccus onubensis]MDP0926165.1 tripartite tricarboxylate transporter TctB family protein [Paracoccus onubensis]
MRATFIVSCLLFLLAVAYWLGADQISVSRLAGGVGADGMPKLLAVALGVLSLALATQTFFQMRAGKLAAPADPVKEGDEPTNWHQHARAMGLIVLGGFYILLLPHLGYMLSSMLMLGGVSFYAGLKPSLRMLVFAVIGGVVYYLIFTRILGIPLPSGFWPRLF